MNTFSHLLIGKRLHAYLEEGHGIRLNKASFLFGNLQPDIKRFYKQRPHQPDGWGRYIKSEIRKLTSYKQESTRFGRNYSRRLGVICHFYTDFCCFPHTKAYEGSSYQHMKYEWELDRFLRKNDEIFSQADFGSAILCKDAENIHGLFDALHRDYLNQEQSFESDITYTLRVCADAITQVTGHSILEKEPPLGALIISAAKG